MTTRDRSRRCFLWGVVLLVAGAVGGWTRPSSATDPDRDDARNTGGPRRQLAFPSAEGYGRFARGGRGGRVLHVTNLNDDGPGSLRAAVEAEGPRTVVFEVSGLITLESPLVVRNPYLTIAGQTAPGAGVCMRKFNLGLYGTHDVVIRCLRVRPGGRFRRDPRRHGDGLFHRLHH